MHLGGTHLVAALVRSKIFYHAFIIPAMGAGGAPKSYG